jgi:hypothetical protein
MPQINGRTLALAIQAVDQAIHQLRALPDDRTTPVDAERLVAFENAADELADLYDESLEDEEGLAPYNTLVRDD